MATPDLTLIPFDAPQWRSRGDMKNTLGPEPTEVFIEAGPRSDWWRTPPGSKPESAVDRRTGPTLTFNVEGEEWSVGCWMRGGLEERFQHAALIVHAGPAVGDPNVSWFKAGVELEGGREYLGCVVTNPYSDWSTSLSPHSVSTTTTAPPTIGVDADAGSPFWLYVQIARAGPDMHCSTALVRGAGADRPPAALRPREEDLVQAREVRGFALGAQSGSWAVGVMACGPLSESTSARFANFSLSGAMPVAIST